MRSNPFIFLVPGQGSDPRGALLGLYRTAESVRREVDGLLDEVEQSAEGSATAVRDILLTEDWKAPLGPGVPQIANYTISVVLARVLATVGVRPDAVVGQSFGEIAALVCAGVFDVSDGVRAVDALNSAFKDFEGKGAMVLVCASERVTRSMLADLGRSDLVVACVNTPQQTIVSGPMDAVDALLSRSAVGPRLVRLPVPYASHHPELQAVAERFRAGLRRIPHRPLGVPVFSPVRRRAYTDSDDLYDALADCVTKPVYLPEILDMVAADRAPFFIELGVGDSLCRCVQATRPESRTLAPLNGSLSWLTEICPDFG
ncbi:acyltransferase domain-containing protein [Nocardia sp. NBC_00508]|uniref:acyltransferase domain-containing protein n=1 Tax=Nocardia sp. NBC_00508 TaxID=2975992 RepID=UPI002E7FE91A|nr:acyltransferase domain-containing protein [Nocardia sp. NBC_00508]WUD65858.1 acyltransferase domain-containing protein [Nocardia sp. NBC_00508]